MDNDEEIYHEVKAFGSVLGAYECLEKYKNDILAENETRNVTTKTDKQERFVCVVNNVDVYDVSIEYINAEVF